MATLHLTATTTVADLRKEFNEAFGAQVKVYIGNKVAEQTATLSAAGLTDSGDFECRSSLTVASFIERMKNEFGLKVKVYTCDEWVAVLDGLTLESAGKVKKNAVKADMESMIAYQRKDDLNGYSIVAEDNGGYSVYQNGILCDNAKSAMREIAALIGMEFDASWTTRQFGAKLLKVIGESETVTASATPSTPTKDNAAAIEAAKIAAEKVKAEAAAAKAAAEKAQAEAATAPTPAASAKTSNNKGALNWFGHLFQARQPAKTSNNKGALNGLFSVADNKKVRFSMGNLQFNAKKYEWRFAEHQYDRIGNDNTKIASNYDGWIDLFGYGTSGYMGCEPFETSTSTQYPQQDIADTNYDWGVYNPISNGGNKEGLWRTLTKDEWDHLFCTRPNAANLRAKACVNGINGLLLLPDDFYEHCVRIPFDSTPAKFSDNNYDLTQWATLQDAGAVFLPCNGVRKGTSMNHLDFYGSYWSSKYYGTSYICGDSKIAYFVDVDSVGCYYYCYGRGVRLVQDVK